MFTLAMPQSLPDADRNASACCRRSVKMADERPCADAFCISMRLIERVERNQVHHRREGFVLDDRPVVLRANDGGSDEIALALEHLLARDDFAAGGLGLRNRLRVALDRALVDQRTHERGRIDRVADAHLRVAHARVSFELVEARAMHQDSSRRRAALSGGAHRAEHDGRHGEFQVRSLVDNDGVVAAELEQALAEPARDALRDIAANRSRARERHQRDAPVVDETRGEFGAARR